jgi:hypothetical protein
MVIFESIVGVSGRLRLLNWMSQRGDLSYRSTREYSWALSLNI